MSRLSRIGVAVVAWMATAGFAADALACATGSVVSLADGSCITYDNTATNTVTTFTFQNVQLCSTCNTNDLVKLDGSNLGVDIYNGSGNLVTGTTKATKTGTGTSQDITFQIDVTSNKAIDGVSLGMTGGVKNAAGRTITGSLLDRTLTSVSEQVYNSGGSQIGSMTANLKTPSGSTSFTPGQTSLTLQKDISAAGANIADGCTSNGACNKHTLFVQSVTQDLTPVPEPGTIGVFATALIGLFAMRRRR